MTIIIDAQITSIEEISINDHDVNRINSIEYIHAGYRQDSKAPTFALTYQGTWMTLVKNCGFTPEVAKSIEESYHKLYRVSTMWVQNQLKEASRVGYVTCAFGLKVRTPLLKQVMYGTGKIPSSAAAEGRTAGNALGQSWCLLNSRAGSEFMQGVRNSEFKHAIKPCSQIHDAQYYLVRDGAYEALLYLNEHLPKAVAWQDDPEIWHDQVKLSGSVEIFYPNWNHGFDISNTANENTIKERIKAHLADLKEKGIAA